ncbi:MAG: polysaccharide biosynthesis C-terminal domain-containing protein [Chitinophagales bacterium]|nr:polysaccharide biosynthesis C-terminal domain-containing protein [Chitinophagales bacterium]MDW8427807.1 polysaccharide biosynthesis C-terminal domain-containing protein [Chitinophagales bacterium]
MQTTAWETLFQAQPFFYLRGEKQVRVQPVFRRLAGQTAIYGLGTIVSRFLNYLLLPIHTAVFRDPKDYGIITEFYAYAAFFNIIFVYGLETAYFRFATLEKDRMRVFSTGMVSLLFSSLLFSGLLIVFSGPLAAAIGYADQQDYVVWFALILGLDALVALPFARLRLQEQALRFAGYRLINVSVNVAMNVLLLLVIPHGLQQHADHSFSKWLLRWYNPDLGVGYVFIANLVASAVTLLLFWQPLTQLSWQMDWRLWRHMINYSLPLVLVGLAGMVDEMLSRAMLKYRLQMPTEEALHHLGVFGANYKLAVLMTLFVQAFRMAAEPFFFNESQKQGAPHVYATTMNYFVAAAGGLFLIVALYLDLFQRLFITPAYYEGGRVVPILLLAQLFLGMYYNLTVWYKLTGHTHLGALVASYGAVFTFVLNWLVIPVYGYVGASWVTFFCYLTMVVISYALGQRYYPVPYQVGRVLLYLVLAVGLYAIAQGLRSFLEPSYYYLLAAFLLAVYGGVIVWIEKRTFRRGP